MKFAIGYLPMTGDPDFFSDIVRDYRHAVEEVYFAWPGEPSGRAPLDSSVVPQIAEELSEIKSLGIKLNLLLNAACYGATALSLAFEKRVRTLVGHLRDNVGLDAVTTMSPVAAQAVRRDFPEIDTRASVNMRMGTPRAMQYTERFFTSYCVQREYNRDPERLEELQAWARDNGKDIHLLINSACLDFCSFQTFHDNAVAHEAEINRRKNLGGFTTLCWEYYSSREHWVNFLRGSWIRPEDVERHARIFKGGYKLATRMHDNPRLVLDAYAGGRYAGNLPDLMEPGFGPLFYPYVMLNARMPDSWFETTMACGKRCKTCGYCSDALDGILMSPVRVV